MYNVTVFVTTGSTHRLVTRMSRLTIFLLSKRSLIDFGQEVPQESLAIEAMVFDNDQEFFGGLCLFTYLRYVWKVLVSGYIQKECKASVASNLVLFCASMFK